MTDEFKKEVDLENEKKNRRNTYIFYPIYGRKTHKIELK